MSYVVIWENVDKGVQGKFHAASVARRREISVRLKVEGGLYQPDVKPRLLEHASSSTLTLGGFVRVTMSKKSRCNLIWSENTV